MKISLLLFTLAASLLIGCREQMPTCVKCGHAFNSATGKKVELFDAASELVEKSAYCQEHSPAYDMIRSEAFNADNARSPAFSRKYFIRQAPLVQCDESGQVPDVRPVKVQFVISDPRYITNTVYVTNEAKCERIYWPFIQTHPQPFNWTNGGGIFTNLHIYVDATRDCTNGLLSESNRIYKALDGLKNAITNSIR